MRAASARNAVATSAHSGFRPIGPRNVVSRLHREEKTEPAPPVESAAKNEVAEKTGTFVPASCLSWRFHKPVQYLPNLLWCAPVPALRYFSSSCGRTPSALATFASVVRVMPPRAPDSILYHCCRPVSPARAAASSWL